MVPNTSGIYRIYSTINGREYIGSAVNLYQRMHHHFHYLRNGRHSNGKLQNYFNKYGPQSLEFEVVKHCKKKILIELEQKCIDGRKPYFNICQTAGNSLGFRHSKETLQRLSDMRKGKYPSHLEGTNHTVEARKKISIKAKERGIPRACVDAAIKANTGMAHNKSTIRRRVEKQTKLTPHDAAQITALLSLGINQMTIAPVFGVCQRTVSRVKQKLGIFGDVDYDAALKRFEAETAQLDIFGEME